MRKHKQKKKRINFPLIFSKGISTFLRSVHNKPHTKPAIRIEHHLDISAPNRGYLIIAVSKEHDPVSNTKYAYLSMRITPVSNNSQWYSPAGLNTAPRVNHQWHSTVLDQVHEFELSVVEHILDGHTLGRSNLPFMRSKSINISDPRSFDELCDFADDLVCRLVVNRELHAYIEANKPKRNCINVTSSEPT